MRLLWRSAYSKVYQGMLRGAKYCITNYGYPVAQDRWYGRLVTGVSSYSGVT